ncbi:hypothetical protein D3C86_1423710 [compost metagenome]
MGAAGHVGQEHHVVQPEQRLGHVRFVFEDVQPGAGDALVGQGVDQRGLVHHGAARDIDQVALRPERLQHAGRDQVACFRPARGGHDQEVRPARQRLHGRLEAIGHAVLRLAAEVAHFHVEARRALRDHAPDTPHADDAQPLAADARG